MQVGKQPAFADSFWASSVHAAATVDSVELLEQLLELGADPHCKMPEKGTTGLMAAAFNNSLKVATFLLLRGSDSNCRDSNGQTALHRATMKGFGDMISLLKSHGARLSIASEDHHTALVYAIQRDFSHLADDLSPDDINQVDEVDEVTGYTHLHHACLAGSTQCVRHLMAKGANPDIQDRCKMTPIMHAISKRFDAITEISCTHV